MSTVAQKLITAEEFAEQTEKILFERQQAGALLDAIGSEQFSKLGAADAGQIISRVSGVSVVGGKYAVIRGLSDRYTRTLLNGVEVPSADPYRMSPQLDLFPSAMVDSVAVSKTFTPDQPGGAAGGGGGTGDAGSRTLTQRRCSPLGQCQQRAVAAARADEGEADGSAVDLADRAKDAFKGYSLGMKQRLGVAAAMLGSPDLLVLDEPTNGLDPAGMADMRALVVALAEAGQTVILSSHILAEVQEICDRVGVIDNGRLLRESTVAELRGGATLRVRATPEDAALAAVRSL